MTDALATVVALLAEEPPRDTGPDFGKAAPFGLLIVVLLVIATFFLIWSMNRHLNKLPESFDMNNPEQDQAVDDGTVGGKPDTAPDSESSPREPGG